MDGLEIYEYHGGGYKPLVYNNEWMVALLNFEDCMSQEKACEIERHVKTDEVFVLLQGRAAFYLVAGDQPLRVIEMQPGLIYNVTQGTWHNLLATKDAMFAIVESRDTDKFDTEIRPLTIEERQLLLELFPWK